MKEQKLSKVDVAMKLFKGGRYFTRALGALWLLMVLAVIVQGLHWSERAAMVVESLNTMYMGESNLYPVTGIDYSLEARVISDDGDSMWYHDIISADIGDLIEVRLKAIAADPISEKDLTDQGLSMRFSDGLSASTVPRSPERVLCPDGTFAQYADDYDDEHITYVALGIYKVGSKDWLSGKSALGCQAYIDGDNVATLLVIWPYCEVDVPLVVFLFICAVICGLVLPLIINIIEPKVVRHLEDMD